MWTVADTLMALLAAGYLIAAAAIYFAAPRRAANRLLSIALCLEPFMFGTQLLLRHLGGGQGDSYAIRSLFVFAAPLWTVLYLGFLGTLPSPLSRPVRTKVGVVALIAYPALMWTAFLVTPDSFLVLLDNQVEDGRLFEAIRIPIFFLMFYALIVALSAWRKADRQSMARARLGVYALAFGARDLLVIAYLVVSLQLLPIASDIATQTAGVLILLPAAVFLPLFTYGVLKYHLFEIDLTIKWTINRTTIAAAFVAVFFAASEGAAAFIETRTGSTAVGIAAAAVLVFALAPLQRLAERVADKAMPNVKDTEKYRLRRKEEVYRATLEEALMDGTITTKERRVLFRLQESIGLEEGAAYRIEREVVDAMGTAR